VRYFWNRTDVTSFTFASVHWADRIVATRISSGFEKFRATFASG
jgi:hypothetical protein